jgi:hypothetical protein
MNKQQKQQKLIRESEGVSRCARAAAAYYRTGGRERIMFADNKSLEGKDYVVLWAGIGAYSEFVVYRVTNSGQLKRIKQPPAYERFKRWPAAVTKA